MPQFLVRIELHDAEDADDYDSLNEEMETAGFSLTMKTVKGVEYYLPTGEYIIEGGQHTMEKVLEKAKQVAHATMHTHSILVSRFTFNLGDGLREVDPPV